MPRFHRIALGITLALALASCAGRVATTPAARSTSLTEAINARAARTPGATIRVIAARLDGRGPRVAINADSLVHAASTMKVPVMIALAQAADRGTLRLDDAVPLTSQFASIVDGSMYTLRSTDDSDDAVYARVGERVPIRWLATRMITHSSNLATNMLLTVVRADSVTAMTRALGTTRMVVRRGVEDTPAFRAGLNNVTTATDLAALMVAIATDRAASVQSCAWMRDVLFAQHWNDAIPVGLPAGTRIAHKTGNITAVEHDAAIVYPAGGAAYVLVVLTSGVASSDEAKTLIADIARLVHPAMR
jgi:beta-lactamase class A